MSIILKIQFEALRKGAKIKKEYELILKNVSVEFEFALRVEDMNSVG